MGKIGENFHRSEEENAATKRAVELFRSCPIPDKHIFPNLGLFLNSRDLARILFMDYIYRKIVDVQGIIFDFGTQWGQNMAIFAALAGIYEPFNRHRKIVGFDSFEGFPAITEEDGKSHLMEAGNLAVTPGYEIYLDEIMKYHELSNPIAHIKKYEIRKGDASSEISKYLADNPETIVAMAYFDFNLYLPTKNCLSAIRPLLVKGSVLAFDELNDHDAPGETGALNEIFGLASIALKRYPHTSRTSYFVVE